MNSKALSEYLVGLSLRERAQNLNKISHDLTICAREFQLPPLSEDKPGAVKKLIGFSELQHKISAQIGHYCAEEATKVYPVEVLSNILFEVATQHGIVSFLKKAVHHTMTGSWGEHEKDIDQDLTTPRKK